MRVFSNTRVVLAVLSLLALLAGAGCSRTKYRLQADRDAYCVIAERNGDPRWHAADTSIEMDPRSRYFDPYDPDAPPMPLDDPTSHQYMRRVDAMKGWKHWLDNGIRPELENPSWTHALVDYVELSDNGAVKLDVDSALELAYVNSPDNQSQLETLYLTALDVTGERFRLDTQFFGGYDANYTHEGSLIPAGLSFDPASGQWAVTPPFEEVESNRLTVGRPFVENPAFEVQRRFATAGQLLVGFANSFVFEFSGGDASLASSLANFTFIQPLLRGAGRDIAFEELTFEERTLLANLRAYAQFRQGFYTQVAIGEVGVVGPQRDGFGTNIPVFSGLGGVGGYAGLLQQLQEIRNSEENLNLQLRTLTQLEAFLKIGTIDLVQVDQFRQSIENERARLLLSRNDLERALDIYKTDTLGLPPDLPIELDDALIKQFQLVSQEATEIQDSIAELQQRVGKLPDNANVEMIREVMNDIFQLLVAAERLLGDVEHDLGRMDDVLPIRERTMTDEQTVQLRSDRQLLDKTLIELKEKFITATELLQGLRNSLTTQTGPETARGLVAWLSETLLPIVRRAVLTQARARLEMVTVEPFELDSHEAFDIALASRFDFMNGRAALVDSWRQIQIQANALQSVLNLTAGGDIRTARNNPVSFRAPTGSLQLGAEFDAPLTRLLERNDYRESLIQYQQSRRDFIQSRDSLHLGLRTLLRQLEQLRANLEIQRRAVAIAIRRVDITQSELRRPTPRPREGERSVQLGPTQAFNLLSALTSLRDTQNNFLRVWLNYYAARMRIARELGIMSLDQDGRWIEIPATSFIPADTEDSMPPDVTPLDTEKQDQPPLVPGFPDGTADVSEFGNGLLPGIPGLTMAAPEFTVRKLPPVPDQTVRIISLLPSVGTE